MRLFTKQNKENIAGTAGVFGRTTGLRLKILAAIGLLVTLALLITDNYAWYSDNTKTGQMDISITSDSTDLTLTGYSFYYGELTYDEEGNVIGAVGARALTDAQQTMNPYDAIMGNNIYTPVYYKISLSGSRFADDNKPPITMTITRTNGAILPTDELGHYYTETNPEHHWTTSKTALYLSNIVQIDWGQANSIANEQSAQIIYDTLQSSAAVSWNGSGSGDPYSFISPIPIPAGRFTQLADNAEKSQTIIITVNDYDTVLVNGAETVILYLRFDYCRPLVEIYLNENYASLSGRLNQTVTEAFLGDISTILLQ